MRNLILTFDIEDYINQREVTALKIILEMLGQHKLRALFFVTGHMAEKLARHPSVIELLRKHEIGFHSSSHSVRPIIAEFSDVQSYTKAQVISFERETSHINPLTGEVEGEGGIYFLQDLFHPRKIEAFRAPGMSWTPPHLEALKELGIRFDFSSNITMSIPIQHGGVTFYPYTFTQTWEGKPSDYTSLFFALLKRQTFVFDLHPTQYIHGVVWDSQYYAGNPERLSEAMQKSSEEIKFFFRRFNGFLKFVGELQKAGILNAEPRPLDSTASLKADKKDVERYYERSVRWPKKYFNYHPKFVRPHFSEFFGTS